MSASKLSAAAVEFRPSFTPVAQSIAVVPSVQQPNQQNEAQFAQQPGAQQAQNQGPSQQQPEGADWCEDEYEDDGSWGYYEAGNWVAYEGQEDDWSASSAAGTEEQQHIQQQHGEQQPSMEADDAVALLHSCYPNHPRTLLQQLVEACDGDVQQAARILSDMDFEQRRSCISAAAAAGRATDTAASAARPSSTAGMSSRKQQQFNYSMEQFPALGGGGPGSSTAAGASASSRQNGLGSGSNWAAAANKPAAATSTKPRPSRQPAQPATTPTAAASKQWDSKGASEAVPWVKTGAAVSQEYAAARAEASDHARVRNACFQQATIAFMAGNKALAKELSAKGKAAAEAMWAAHERASSQIYSQRNARLQQQVAGSSKGSAAPVIDLHGLHVQEMMQTLPQQLAALAKQQHESASVIVGVGKHTKGPPAARMGPAVEALLKELGYSFKQPQPGLLRVRLR